MTVVLTAGSPYGIVMAADSAVVHDFDHGVREYDTGRKLWHVPTVGFVATWGARDSNGISRHLTDQWSDVAGRTIGDLARSVHSYLVGDYRPDELGLQDVGYHIAGIYADGTPAVYHSYFNTARNPTSFGNYDFQMIGPRLSDTQYLYNGRNDIAHSIITTLIAEARLGRDPRFRGESLAEIAHLAHFVLRVATEITPTVSPPYIICAKHSSGQEIKRSYNKGDTSLDQFRHDFAPRDPQP
jgi:hypothetical protein